MLSTINLLVISLCSAVAIPDEVNIVGPKSAGTSTSVNAQPGVTSSAGSAAGSAAGSTSISPDNTPAIDNLPQSGPGGFEGSLASGSGSAFSGRVLDLGYNGPDLSGYDRSPQYGQGSGSFASGSGLGVAGNVYPSQLGQSGGSYAAGSGVGAAGGISPSQFGQGAEGSYASGSGVGVAGNLYPSQLGQGAEGSYASGTGLAAAGRVGADLSGVGNGPGLQDQVTGGYNPYSPFADFCYGNSNCINGYPKQYFQGGPGISVGSYQGIRTERFPQSQGSYGSGYGSGIGTSISSPVGSAAYGAGYGSAYAS